MLSTTTRKMIVPAFFQPRLFVILQNVTSALQNDPAIPADYIEDFEYDFYECVSEFHEAISKKQLIYATKIIDHFYSKWLQASPFSDGVNHVIDTAMTSALASLTMMHLAFELASITHYSLNTACGLTMLFVRVGFKITTAEWVSVGLLSGGFFQCRYVKTKPAGRISSSLRK